ncbi:hypothetical protein MMC24_001789 [Lignoscripta atroalba]|nr:hypothetical protein [Lignoscripta atroalba]
MADAGRKNVSTRAKEDMTPNSMKSTQEKLRENTSNAADRVSRGATKDDSNDRTQGGSDNTSNVGDKMKGSLGIGKN